MPACRRNKKLTVVRWGVLAVLALWLLLLFAGTGLALSKFSGTYRLEGWRAMEKQGLYHFFYLHPGGHFLLGAAWPGHESSRFAGTWHVSGDRIQLTGTGQVNTSQGNWKVEFQRTFIISTGDFGYRLAPMPEKNRFGMLGWPNAFRFHRRQPAPNLPEKGIPDSEEEILRYIQALLKK